MKIALAAGAFALLLSACGQTESAEETQEDAGSIIIEKLMMLMRRGKRSLLI